MAKIFFIDNFSVNYSSVNIRVLCCFLDKSEVFVSHLTFFPTLVIYSYIQIYVHFIDILFMRN